MTININLAQQSRPLQQQEQRLIQSPYPSSSSQQQQDELDNESNAFVDKFPVRLTLGTETQTYRLDSQNAFSATLTTINGTPLKYNDQVQVNISKEYGNGNVYAVEKHIVTIPANPNNLGSGGI